MIESDYIRELIIRVRSILNEKLVNLYIIGSISLEDYIESKSDLDVFGITNGSLTDHEKDQLANILSNTNFPCPAKGLDIVLIGKQDIENIKPEPKYEFWYSTGSQWPEEKWEKGVSSEMILLMELCRQNGIKIYGKESQIIFREIDKNLILKAFKQILIWHKDHVLDDYHDPNGQNSVLNACRILKYIEKNKFYSKTAGGKLFLIDDPNNSTVRKVLRNRELEDSCKISKEEIMNLIKTVEKKLKQALKPTDIF